MDSLAAAPGTGPATSPLPILRKPRPAAKFQDLPTDRTLVMGILNVTPDSFSDGGAYATADTAIAAGLRMFYAGADIIDVGGESTRPGATAVGADEEQRRVLPVIEALVKAGALVSIDTTHAATGSHSLSTRCCTWTSAKRPLPTTSWTPRITARWPTASGTGSPVSR